MTAGRLAPDKPRDVFEKTLSEKAFNLLRHDILAGRLKPTERLKLVELQKHYSIGISPIRESLMRLEGDGLVVSEGQKGFAVASVSLKELQDLTWARQQLEAVMITSAIDRGNAEWEAAIIAAFHRLSKTPLPSNSADLSTANSWEERHREFHHALVSACDSPWLMRFHAQLVDHSERYRRVRMFHSFPMEQQARNIDLEHRAIMEAVIARSADDAVRLLTQHIQRTADIVANYWNADDVP